MAPIMELELLTGLAETGFESHFFILKCVDIAIDAYLVMITIILQKLYEKKK